MRTYSNFLLFEDILANLPQGSTLLLQMANLLINPPVKIVEEDCATLLGEISDLDFEKEGLIELATGEPLSRDRISEILASGKYKVAIRSLHSCISQGGICRKCYQSFYLGKTSPGIGTQVSIEPRLNYQTDIISGNGYSASYTLSQSEDEFDSALVIRDGVIQTEGFSISGSIITFDDIITPIDIYTIRFYRITSEPLLGYVARSYSGDLLGIKPLPTLETPIREGLYKDIISEGMVELMKMELAPYRAIPSTYIEYIDRIYDKLEKVLFILYLYAIFANVEV